MKRTPLKRGKPLTAKTPMRKRSAKREAYIASPEFQEGVDHMGRVKMLPCVACGHSPPSDAHHVTGDKKPRNDMRVIPLCKPCHLRYHARKRSWVADHGPDYMLLDRVAEMLQTQ